jgi:excisionase family DNA binding protein
MSSVFEEAVTPTVAEAAMALESSRQLAKAGPRKITLHVPANGRKTHAVELPESAVRLLMRILTEMASGNAVTLIPIHAELTTQEAAQLLGVSRPFLIKLLETGKLPFRNVGTHRRVLFQDLLEYKGAVDARREKSLESLAAQAQELNMGY